jgi:hypothetical protein
VRLAVMEKQQLLRGILGELKPLIEKEYAKMHYLFIVKIDNAILEALQNAFDYKLRFSEVRNAILMEFALNKSKAEQHSLTVKVSRHLTSLCNRELVEKINLGHQNVVYKLTENAFENILKQSKDQIPISFLGIGLYKPGDTYEQLRRKLVARLEEALHWKEDFAKLIKKYEEKRRK